MKPLQRLVDSAVFTTLVIAVILANAVVLGLQTYSGIDREYGDTLDFLNAAFLAFFVVELTLRIAAYGQRPWDFFRSGWNVFDFTVIAVAFLPGVRESSTLLRLARLARVVRVVRLLPDLRVLLTAVVRSLPPLGSMGLLSCSTRWRRRGNWSASGRSRRATSRRSPSGFRFSGSRSTSSSASCTSATSSSRSAAAVGRAANAARPRNRSLSRRVRLRRPHRARLPSRRRGPR
jgi:Ion transport protein